MTAYEEAVDILTMLHQLPKDFADIGRLVQARFKLSTVSTMLAIEYGTDIKAYHASYFNRKNEWSKVAKEKMETMSGVKSEVEANVSTADHLKAENVWEGNCKAMKALLDQINKVLDSTSGKIKYLQEELNEAKKT
jgi:hypothetical protein